MDNQGVGNRKIVLKHRSLGDKNPSDSDAVALEHKEATTTKTHERVDSPGDGSTLHYQGEIFDQFYRPLSALGGDVRLAELAEESLLAAHSKGQLAPSEAAVRDVSHQQAAEALAKQVYNLAQGLRENDVDVYLSAFNVVLANHDCYQARDILTRANQYFTNRYYDEIRERGERPEILSQIVKRVGHAAADRIGRIVSGMDVRQTAAELWSTYHGPLPHRMAVIEDLLLDCTERQVRALRSEFLVVPFRDIARQLKEILQSSAGEASSSSRRSAGRAEAYDSKRHQAFHARDQLRAIRYLLLGRSEEEVELIKKFFIEADDSDRMAHEKTLETALSKQFLHAELDRLGTLFSGWTAESEAEEIHKLLYPHALAAEIDDVLSDPRDSVDRDFGQGIGPFLRRFKKRRMWLGRTDLKSRVLNVFEVLAERVAALTIDRFMQTNEVLLTRYGYELDLAWFPTGNLFDARALAAVVNDRICAAYDFFEIIKPIEFLGPRECLAIQKAYACQFGIELKDAIDSRLNSIRDKIPQAEREKLYARYLDGKGRWPLAVDLLGRYRGEEYESSEWSPDFAPTKEEEELAIRIAQEVDREVKKGELDKAIAALIEGLDQQRLRRLERTFLEMTDPPMPLERALSDVLSTEAFARYQVAVYGLDLEEVTSRIAEDPLTLTSLRHLPISILRIIRSQFQLKFNQKLDLFVMGQFPLAHDEDIAIELLSIAYTPEAYLFRPAIQEFRKEIPSHLEGLRRFWNRDLLGRMGIERAIDLQFPRFRVLVKQAAARQSLVPAVLAEIILSFEGVSPDITSKILECFDAVDIGQLISILRANIHSQSIIEEVYDLLFPEAQLRSAIKAMKVDLDLINEALLHLDGFSAEVVAEELHELANSLSGTELGQEIVALLSPSTEHHRNPRIPDDVNWMDEMMYQTGLAFERLYAADLFETCEQRGVPLEYIEQIARRIFGLDVCSTADEINQLIKMGREGIEVPDGMEGRLASFFESRGARHRERIVRAYEAFWARQAGHKGLHEDFASFVKESSSKRKILAIISAVGQR